MDIKEINEWVTVVGAVIAAISGCWSLLLQLRGKRDSYTVRLGTVSPSINQETSLHVVSLSDHPILLNDWGFIEASGLFSSIPLDEDTRDLQPEDVVCHGSSRLQARGETFEAGYIRSRTPIGAYAKSATHTRPRIGFFADTPYRLRLAVWFRLRISPNHFLWEPRGWPFEKPTQVRSPLDF